MSRILLSAVKLGMRRSGCRRWRRSGLEHDAMAVPALGDGGRLVALVGQLEAPGAVDQGGRRAQLALDALGLQVLGEGHAVDHEGAGKVVGVDAAGLAGTVDAGGARTEPPGHEARLADTPS